jgi:hypothetical protein
MEVKRYYIVLYILYIINPTTQKLIRGPDGSMIWVVGSNNSYKPIPNTSGFAPGFVNYKKGALDSHPI